MNPAKPRLALFLSVSILAVAGMSGCGGSDGDSSDTGGSDADQAAVEKLNERVATLVKKGDAGSFCAEFAPSQLKDTFGSVKKCVKRVDPLMKVMAQSTDFGVESLEVNGNYATIIYSNGEGIGTFTREDGRWYIGAPVSE